MRWSLIKRNERRKFNSKKKYYVKLGMSRERERAKSLFYVNKVNEQNLLKKETFYFSLLKILYYLLK